MNRDRGTRHVILWQLNVPATDHLTGQSITWNVGLAAQASEWIDSQPWADNITTDIPSALTAIPTQGAIGGVTYSATVNQ